MGIERSVAAYCLRRSFSECRKLLGRTPIVHPSTPMTTFSDVTIVTFPDRRPRSRRTVAPPPPETAETPPRPSGPRHAAPTRPSGSRRSRRRQRRPRPATQSWLNWLTITLTRRNAVAATAATITDRIRTTPGFPDRMLSPSLRRPRMDRPRIGDQGVPPCLFLELLPTDSRQVSPDFIHHSGVSKTPFVHQPHSVRPSVHGGTPRQYGQAIIGNQPPWPQTAGRQHGPFRRCPLGPRFAPPTNPCPHTSGTPDGNRGSSGTSCTVSASQVDLPSCRKSTSLRSETGAGVDVVETQVVG